MLIGERMFSPQSTKRKIDSGLNLKFKSEVQVCGSPEAKTLAEYRYEPLLIANKKHFKELAMMMWLFKLLTGMFYGRCSQHNFSHS